MWYINTFLHNWAECCCSNILNLPPYEKKNYMTHNKIQFIGKHFLNFLYEARNNICWTKLASEIKQKTSAKDKTTKILCVWRQPIERLTMGTVLKNCEQFLKISVLHKTVYLYTNEARYSLYTNYFKFFLMGTVFFLPRIT